ncbi:MAG: hypothetical protein AB1750_03050 [Chloroflexota bacterium]
MKTFNIARFPLVEFFRVRLPTGREIFPVYGLIVFIVFNWSVVNVFWRLPSWLMFLSAGELTGAISYVLMNDLLESLFVLVLILAAGAALPVGALRARFAARGGALALFMSLWAGTLNFILAWDTLTLSQLLASGALFLFSSILLLYIFKLFPFLERGMEKLCGQVSVFVYFYVPLGALGLLVALVRNLLGMGV